MAGRVPQRPPPVTVLTSVPGVEDSATARAFTQLGTAVQKLQAASSRVQLRADLAIGKNVLRHGLGRALEGYSLTATVANAAFAHALDTTNPNPELEIWITVAGTAQPGARVEVW